MKTENFFCDSCGQPVDISDLFVIHIRTYFPDMYLAHKEICRVCMVFLNNEGNLKLDRDMILNKIMAKDDKEDTKKAPEG